MIILASCFYNIHHVIKLQLCIYIHTQKQNTVTERNTYTLLCQYNIGRLQKSSHEGMITVKNSSYSVEKVGE